MLLNRRDDQRYVTKRLQEPARQKETALLLVSVMNGQIHDRLDDAVLFTKLPSESYENLLVHPPESLL